MSTDAEHLRAWRDGDEEAGKLLFESLFDDLFRFFRNKCPDPEDMVQRTLLGCVEAADTFEGRSSFRVFVFSIAKNQLFSHWRRAYGGRREVAIGSMSLEALQRSPSRVVADREEHRRVGQALRAVPLDDQILLECYYWQGLRGPELAALFAVGEPTIRSRIRRALARVRQAVARQGTTGDVTSTLESLDRWAEQLGTG